MTIKYSPWVGESQMRAHGRMYYALVCRPAIVKILDILATLATSLRIGYEQGPVLDMEGPTQQ